MLVKLEIPAEYSYWAMLILAPYNDRLSSLTAYFSFSKNNFLMCIFLCLFSCAFLTARFEVQKKVRIFYAHFQWPIVTFYGLKYDVDLWPFFRRTLFRSLGRKTIINQFLHIDLISALLFSGRSKYLRRIKNRANCDW